MPIISQETWDNMPENEKQNIRDEYNSQVEETIAGHWMRQCMEIHFGKKNLQYTPKIRTWEDCQEMNEDSNFFLRVDDNLELPEEFSLKCKAFLKISKIIELGYGGAITDDEWTEQDVIKYIITPSFAEKNRLQYEDVLLYSRKTPIAFRTPAQRDEFMSYPENVKLVQQYYML